jgi:hypothetical protein
LDSSVHFWSVVNLYCMTYSLQGVALISPFASLFVKKVVAQLLQISSTPSPLFMESECQLSWSREPVVVNVLMYKDPVSKRKIHYFFKTKLDIIFTHRPTYLKLSMSWLSSTRVLYVEWNSCE